MKSLKDEVVPFLAKASWMHGLREKAGWNAQESPSYAQGTMHASREETSRVHRSTTYVDPALLHGRAENGHLSVQHARPSPLFTPDMSRAPSPRTKTVSLAPADREERKARARKSAAQVRCVALIERLSQTRNQPIEPGMTIDEVRQSEADDLASVDRFVARANTLPTYIECNRYVSAEPNPLPHLSPATFADSLSYSRWYSCCDLSHPALQAPSYQVRLRIRYQSSLRRQQSPLTLEPKSRQTRSLETAQR